MEIQSFSMKFLFSGASLFFFFFTFCNFILKDLVKAFRDLFFNPDNTDSVWNLLKFSVLIHSQIDSVLSQH